MNASAFLPVIGTIFLVLAVAAILHLGGQAWSQLEEARPVRVTAESRDDERRLTALSMPAARPEVYYASVLERPLFAPARRALSLDQDVNESIPDSDPIDPVVSVAVPPPPRLKGILAGTTSPSALLQSAEGAQSWVRPSESFGGWTLVEVGQTDVKISAENQTIILELYP